MDDDGKTISTPLKASRLGKFAGREAVDQRYQKAKEKIDVRPTKRKVAAVMAQSSGKDDFIARLKAENIDLVLRYTDDGRIYGATYIDHNSRTVLNGSRLGKEFSANALEKWFNNPEDKPIVQTHGNTQDNSTTPDNSQHQSHEGSGQSGGTASGNQSNRHGHTAQSTSAQSQSHGYDDTSMFEGLGGLFSVGPAFDAQEEAFYREMQRRKKKKRRGPKL